MPRDSRTTVQLFNVPWDMGYRNLRYFSSASSRDSWFSDRAKETVTPNGGNIAVIKGSPVFPPRPYVVKQNWDALHNWNYMRFKNSAYPNPEWQYAFITHMEDVGEHTTRLYYKIDAWVNNIGRMSMRPCLVERMHTPGDAVTYEAEPFSVNAYVTKFNHGMAIPSSTFRYYMIATGHPIKDVHVDFTSIIDNVQYSFYMRAGNTWSEMQAELERYNDNGTSDRIIGVFCVPSNYITIKEDSANRCEISFSGTKKYAVARDTGSYSPKNKKCLQYPYCYCIVSDMQKSSRTYKWEDGGGKLKFGADGGVHPGGCINLYPEFTDCDFRYLENMVNNIVCPVGYTASGWSNWLAQNQAQIKAQQNSTAVSIGTAVTTAAIGAGIGLATGGAGAAIGASVASTAFGQAASAVQTANSISSSVETAKWTPNPSQMPDGSMVYILKNGMSGFTAYSVYPRKKEFESLDAFFSRYGYALNKIRSIDPTVRSSFCYYKTAGANVIGKCPQADREVIAAALDRGVTFWRTDDIGNYSLSNN